jgi:hypothetical protein
MLTDVDVLAKLALPVARAAWWLALSATVAVIVERAAVGIGQLRRRRLEARYAPLVRRALAEDEDAERALTACPHRHRLDIATLLIAPLTNDREPGRIASTRRVVEALSLTRDAERMLKSRRWWRRAVALRALGLLQDRRYTAHAVAALDDPSADVRAAALDALADLCDPASLPAVVVRLLDTSLHRGRRAAAVAAFGPAAEPLVLDLAEIDAGHRVCYARALAICGTAAARPALCRWVSGGSRDLRAAALAALAHTGLDPRAATVAVAALETPDPDIRAAAAAALAGWTGCPDATAPLARHLDDHWPVAAAAARALHAMGPSGREALLAAAQRTDLTGRLARQALWRPQAQA